MSIETAFYNALGDYQNAIWEVQLANWPDSVPMTHSDALAWAEQNQERGGYMAVAMAIQHPGGIWYALRPGGPLRGYRFGLNDEEYISGFGWEGEQP